MPLAIEETKVNDLVKILSMNKVSLKTLASGGNTMTELLQLGKSYRGSNCGLN